MVAQALQRARVQFVAVAAAWSLCLAGVFLAVYFQASPDRIALLFLFSQALILGLLLVFEASLYGAARPVEDARRPEFEPNEPVE